MGGRALWKRKEEASCPQPLGEYEMIQPMQELGAALRETQTENTHIPRAQKAL